MVDFELRATEAVKEGVEHAMKDMERHAKHFVKAPKAELKDLSNKPREVLSQYEQGVKILKAPPGRATPCSRA